MKDQYVGDVNDYLKYGLLRAAARAGTRLLVAWMRTPPDGGTHGRRRGYLRRPEAWRDADPPLFDALAAATAPSLAWVEGSGLLPGARFFGDAVPAGRAARAAWRRRLLAAAADADLVFLDPDNGLAVPSVPPGRAASARYVYPETVAGLWAAGRAVLVFQHFARRRREVEIARRSAQIQALTPGGDHLVFAGAHAFFLLAAPRAQAVRWAAVTREVAGRWGERLAVVRARRP
ncbi:hypothetical protein [Inmirania thermothiophila]|uniref:Uncharacterized protein n=1 Tax=Inmirania thermothiophila TaxID=1750597 RepID=A0A3N1Y031_9GAMM|nr:hypothetical protein [Inmirania thermothiophila]ROR32204.1 hypothetical protein EDC57_1401 [Inmirania thermothiophila]